MRVKGEWPRRLTFLQGFGLGVARPWNDDVQAAAIRISRGSAGFLSDCVSELSALQPQLKAAYSPPLTGGSNQMWLKAGFSIEHSLDVYEREIGFVIANPTTSIVQGDQEDLDEISEVDRRAFPEFWRFGRPGIEDALQSAPANALILSMHEQQVAGFCIMGLSSQRSYLQRIAVDPAQQGNGHGSSLVRAGLQWASRRGATAATLNTQPDNSSSKALYAREGFTHHPGAVLLMGKAL
jgi:ribosomal protein S18 acetylase RimI-like enzyme